MVNFEAIRSLPEGRIMEAAEVPGPAATLLPHPCIPFLAPKVSFLPVGRRFPPGNSQYELFRLSLAT